jgi:hypothetical protein
MKKHILFGFLLLIAAVGCSPVFGQFEALNKVKNKAREAVKKQTSEDASPEPGNDRVPGSARIGKTAVDTGLEIVLTKREYKSFDEAKTSSVSRVSDGEPLWLYLKFKDSLAKYAYKNPYADAEGNINYFLYVEIGARGKDGEVYANDVLIFKKEELSQNELKIALAPGRAGRNKSLSMFLEAVGGGDAGVWDNEIRISNVPAAPRSAKDYLARATVTADVSDGIARYRKMKSEYAQTVARGAAEENKLPAPGRYSNDQLKTEILNMLKSEGIVPVKFYFSSDEWVEYTENNVKQNRKVYAAYTYKNGGECLYGIAEVVQDYSYVSAGYGAANIYLRKDSPILCAGLQ